MGEFISCTEILMSSFVQKENKTKEWNNLEVRDDLHECVSTNAYHA